MQFACVLLAAGRSRRMQGPNKLLLKVGDVSLVRRTASEIIKVPCSQKIAVTGHDGDFIFGELEGLPFERVHNLDHVSGMHSSIRAGVRALHRAVDAFFVCLGDQPHFDSSVLLEMMERFSQISDRRTILYPTYAGERGQPVLIGADFIPEILQHEDADHGCYYLFERHPEAVQAIAIDNQKMRIDIDQPQDYQTLLKDLSHG